MKLKVLGMALLAVAATSAFAVTNASGTAAGHFVHHNPNGNNAWITGHEAKGTSHQLKFTRLAAGTHNTTGASIECEKATYSGTVTAKTVTSIQVTPTYTNCNTEGEAPNTTKVDVNGCSYTFLSQGARAHGTVLVDCPIKPLEVTDTTTSCTVTIPTQTTAATLTDGISYTNLADGTITAHVTVNTITGHLDGFCAIIGKAQKFEMKGSVTVEGYEDLAGGAEGNKITITST